MDLSKLSIHSKISETTSNQVTEISAKAIAVIGMALNLPGAKTPDQLWENLADGLDLITDFPETRRQDTDNFLRYCGADIHRIKYKPGAYLDRIDGFDYSFFGLSPKEASLMSPDQRLFLAAVWQAIEDAGYGGNKLYGTKTGVFLGYNADSVYDYKRLISEVEPESLITAMPGNLTSMIPARIAYLLDLKGAAVSVDTACSASLAAVHLACRSLRNQECDLAIAGSVKVMILPVDSGQRLGIESLDSRARSFDDSADGTGMGEGVAAVILKPLNRAIADGDQIYAVIKGSAINQDGRSIGITAPNAAAQAEVITAAWEDAGIEPETISYIEAHGTGTKLGDPIEIDGLRRAFAKYTKDKHFCAIGSLKTNIGHLDNAAGIAGLIKSILALQHKKLPPSLHFNRPNRGIDFSQTPVYVNDRLTDWSVKEGIPRRCGVSAFGLSGTNCHVILEEAPEVEKHPPVDPFNILTLSARTKEALFNLIKEFSKYLQDTPGVNPADLCYTANTGRGHYQYRLAVIFESLEELKAILYDLAGIGNREIIAPEGVYLSENLRTGIINKNETTAEVNKAEVDKSELKEEAAQNLTQYLQQNNKELAHAGVLSKLGALYAKGADIDWPTFYHNQRYFKISLPGYPFDPKRCWLKIPETAKNAEVNSILRGQPKRRLPEVILTGDENAGYSPTEKIMGTIWAEVLGLDEIDVNSGFYELGGDSIIALKIANRFEDVTGRKLEINQIMQYGAVKKLSAAIDEQPETQAPELTNEIRRAELCDFYPLSSAQMRMYILSQFEGVGTSYNMPMAIKVEGALDFLKLNQALQQLIARHEILRTSFQLSAGALVQEIHEKVEFQAELVDLGAHETPEDLIKSLIKPFDLSKAPLLRAYVLKVSEAEQIIFFDMHHIITDGISSVIFDQELIALYQGKELPEIRVQYKDYAVWQNNRLTSGFLNNQEAHWLAEFSGEIPVLNLPTDFPRPAVQSFEGDRVIFKADRELTGEIIRLAEKTDTTLYMVLLAAYNVLLAKYTRQEDLVIASPVAGRNRTELERVIGIFVNTVLMRNYPGPVKTFLEFLGEVKQNALAAYENRDYPFETLISRLNPVRDLSRNPLFDTMLTLQNTEKLDIDTGALKFRQLEFENKIAKFDLNLNITLEDDGLKFDMEYCARLFRRSTIDRMATHFINVFKEITRDPGQSITGITILTEVERKQLLFDYNNTGASYPEITIPELFQQQVMKNPQAIAVIIGNQGLSYGELNQKSNQLAKLLRDKGVTADTVVAISAGRSLELIIGIMGILKSGGAYLPIDPEFPEERVGFILKDSGAQLLLAVHEQSVDPESSITVLNLKDGDLYQGAGADLENISQPSDLAYVIYTSGSTGRPKGVGVEHRSLVNFLYCIYENFDRQVGPVDNCLSLTSISFDVSVCELFLPLAFGAKLVLYEMSKPTDIFHLSRSLIENAITFAYVPPGLLTELATLLKPYGNEVKLNKMLVGVEPILEQTLAEFLRLNEAMRIINGYGPTEDTICATFYKFDSSARSARAIVPIGKPLSNTRIYLLDQGNNPVPEGVPGELCIAGHGLSRGYLNRSELTAEKFVPNPFIPISVEAFHVETAPPQEGIHETYLQQIYRTGDLARWASDGNIEFLGRMDYQVKIRGYRIELGEIEAQLLKYEEVQEAVVVAGAAVSANPAGAKYLCAYLSADRELTSQELRAYLSGVLPEYMVPSVFIQLPKLPLTPNGKINRKALPEPNFNIQTGASAPGREYEGPRNELEKQLAVLWEEVLGIERVGIRDNFFELGGNSLNATALQTGIYKEYNVEVPLRQIFRTPTIAGIAEYLVKGAECSSAPIPNTAEEGYSIISEAQQNEHHQFYNVKDFILYEVDGTDTKALQINLQNEITTYLCHALPLCVILADSKLLPWYYEHFINLFSIVDESGYLILEFLEYRASYKEVMYEVYLGYNLLKNESNIVNYIVDKINSGYYVIISVDEYYLSVKSKYQKEHFVHHSLIYGYDNVHEKLLAIGFNHEQIFGPITFDYEPFMIAYEEGKQYYQESAPWAENNAIELLKLKAYQQEYPFALQKFLFQIDNYLAATGDDAIIYTFRMDYEKVKYGIQIYDEIITHLEDFLQGQITIDYRAIHLLSEHKKCIYTRLLYIITRYNLTGHLVKITEEYGQVVEQVEFIRKKFLQFNYLDAINVADLQNIIKETVATIQLIREKEQIILTEVSRQLHAIIKG